MRARVRVCLCVCVGGMGALLPGRPVQFCLLLEVFCHASINVRKLFIKYPPLYVAMFLLIQMGELVQLRLNELALHYRIKPFCMKSLIKFMKDLHFLDSHSKACTNIENAGVRCIL